MILPSLSLRPSFRPSVRTSLSESASEEARPSCPRRDVSNRKRELSSTPARPLSVCLLLAQKLRLRIGARRTSRTELHIEGFFVFHKRACAVMEAAAAFPFCCTVSVCVGGMCQMVSVRRPPLLLSPLSLQARYSNSAFSLSFFIFAACLPPSLSPSAAFLLLSSSPMGIGYLFPSHSLALPSSAVSPHLLTLPTLAHSLTHCIAGRSQILQTWFI